MMRCLYADVPCWIAKGFGVTLFGAASGLRTRRTNTGKNTRVTVSGLPVRFQSCVGIEWHPSGDGLVAKRMDTRRSSNSSEQTLR